MTSSQQKPSQTSRLPTWLRRVLPKRQKLSSTQAVLHHNALPTVCEEALCPNKTECWSRQTATYLALGKTCTRNCGFCEIDYSHVPPPLDPEEPHKIAISAKQLQLKHVVITMVTRDDLPDGGASAIVEIIQELRRELPHATIEVLTSDFNGNTDAWRMVLDAKPDIFNHNIETVRRLTPIVRHKATYDRSLEVLAFASTNYPHLLIKSGIMVGLGELENEIKMTLKDLAQVGVHIVTIGQYLRPSKRKIPVKAFVSPETFHYYTTIGSQLGLFVYAGPFVRSSYNAQHILQQLQASHK